MSQPGDHVRAERIDYIANLEEIARRAFQDRPCQYNQDDYCQEHDYGMPCLMELIRDTGLVP